MKNSILRTKQESLKLKSEREQNISKLEFRPIENNLYGDLEEILQFYDFIMPIRVPCYNEMLNIIANLSTTHSSNELVLADLGIGTGNLEEMLLSTQKDVTIIGYDYSKEMLDYTACKLGELGDKLRLIQIDFVKQRIPVVLKCDVVISNLTLHSLPNEVKFEVFKSSFDMLKKDGVFIIGDKFKSESKVVNSLFDRISDEWRASTKKDWAEHEYKKYEKVWKLQGNGQEYRDTMENYYNTLRNFGFKEMDCIWKLYGYGILYIKK